MLVKLKTVSCYALRQENVVEQKSISQAQKWKDSMVYAEKL